MIDFSQEIRRLENTISRCQMNKRSASNKYQSLSQFKSYVTRNQENYKYCMSMKKNTISSWESISETSQSANHYMGGMNNRLTGVGAICVSAAYIAFLLQISIKLAQYQVMMDAAQTQIGICNTVLDNYRKLQAGNETNE